MSNDFRGAGRSTEFRGRSTGAMEGVGSGAEPMINNDDDDQSRRKHPPYPPAGGGAHVDQGPHVTYGKIFSSTLMFSKYL